MDCCGLRDGRRGLPLRIYMKYALDPRSARCRVVNRERTTRSDATAADQEAIPPRACTLAENVRMDSQPYSCYCREQRPGTGDIHSVGQTRG